jgi:hypothetical protein
MDPSLVPDRIKEYVQRVQSRPAYIKALEKGPDYVYGKLREIFSIPLCKEPATERLHDTGPKNKL